MTEEMIVEYKGYLHDRAIQDYEYQCQRTAPHVIHNAKVMRDGNEYCCIMGDDLMNGISGFGKTPKEACAEFDYIWQYGEKDL